MAVLIRAEETNRDVSEERLQDDRVSIQASDGEFPEHHSLEAIFFDPEPNIQIKMAATRSNLKLHHEVFQQKIKR